MYVCMYEKMQVMRMQAQPIRLPCAACMHFSRRLFDSCDLLTGHGTSDTKGQGSNSSSLSGRTKTSHPALSGGFGHFASIQLPPVLPQPSPFSQPSTADVAMSATASSLAPPAGFHVAACQACSMVIFTSKPKGGQHTSCPLAGQANIPGVQGKVPAMPSLHYFPDDPAMRVCACMPRAAKPSDAPFVFCPGCKTRSGQPVAHPNEKPFITRVKGGLPPWKRAAGESVG